MYPENTPFPVYQYEAWYSDQWDPMAFGREIDFSRPFFAQWFDLMNTVPRLNVDLVNCENSDYCNYCGDAKNCYLDIAGEGNEDCYYNLFTKFSKNCVDNTFIYHSTLCYECINCHHAYNCRYSTYLDTCSDCSFCFDLKGCNNCLFSINLRNKQYYIFNEPYSKFDYEQRLRALDLGSAQAVEDAVAQWDTFRLEKGIYRDIYLLNSENCSGNDITGCENCSDAFNVTNCEDCKYLYDVLDATDCYDLNYSLYHPEASYELISTLQLQYSAFNMASHYSSRLFYCSLSNNSHDCFGCIALNHKEYCVLNKQYTKAEYHRLVPQLINQMQTTGEWGEFFPASLSPFGYNETVAQEYYPLTKEEAHNDGFIWREIPVAETIEHRTVLPDNIAETSETDITPVYSCSECQKGFRIIRQELAWYQISQVPLPQRCPNCRHSTRMKRRNPRTLRQSSCNNCGKSILTTYPLISRERVYCERCYFEAVY